MPEIITQMNVNTSGAYALHDIADGHNIAPTYQATSSYNSGDFVLYGGQLYYAVADTGSGWNENNWNSTTVTEYYNGRITSAEANIATLTGNVSALNSNVSSLTTTTETMQTQFNLMQVNMSNYAAALSRIISAYNSSVSYQVNDYCINNNKVYRCISSTTGIWDSTKWTEIVLCDDIAGIKNQVATVNVNLLNLQSVVSGKESTSNKITSISSESTDTQYPSAKAVYEAIQQAIASLNSGSDS